MIAHVVLMQPRPDLSSDEGRALVAAFERAVRGIPTVRHVRVGARVVHGAGYERQMPPSGEYLVVIDFDDLTGLQTYLRHPAHLELGARFGQALASALVYDFDVDGLDKLQTLV